MHREEKPPLGVVGHVEETRVDDQNAATGVAGERAGDIVRDIGMADFEPGILEGLSQDLLVPAGDGRGTDQRVLFGHATSVSGLGALPPPSKKEGGMTPQAARGSSTCRLGRDQ